MRQKYRKSDGAASKTQPTFSLKQKIEEGERGFKEKVGWVFA